MKKNKLFIILIITISALVFTTAQICNQCGAIGAQETKEDVADESDRDDTSSETTAGTTQSTSQSTEAPVEGNHPPEIVEMETMGVNVELAASEGFFDALLARDVVGEEFEFTIEAQDEDGDELSYTAHDSQGNNFDVTKTDNNNAEFTWLVPDLWGPYTLTIEVSDGKGGNDIYPIEMVIVLEVAEAVEPEPAEVVDDIEADVPLSGMIMFDWVAEQGEDPVFVGDTPMDLPVKAYLSFDISDLSALDDVTIKDASVSIPIDMIVDHPELGGPEIHILVFYYEEELTLDDQIRGGVRVKEIETSDSLTNLDFTSSELEDELQNAVDTGLEWFQLKISPTGINENGIWDYYMIPTSSTVLYVTYEIPG